MGRLGVHRVHAGHVQRHRIEGGEHAHIGHDGHVVLGTAVAVGGHVDDQRDVEAGPVVADGSGRRGFAVLTKGIGETKNATLFGNIKLVK